MASNSRQPWRLVVLALVVLAGELVVIAGASRSDSCFFDLLSYTPLSSSRSVCSRSVCSSFHYRDISLRAEG